MKHTSLFIATSFILLASGCATTKNTAKVRSIDYEEASVFERSLQTSVPPAPIKPATMLFTQPNNKTEPCKLPTTREQLGRTNFRSYWDGPCKNGYAFGLGRDIAISDTHHHEEITIHNGTGQNDQSPSVNYDFVNNRVSYVTPGEKFPETAWFYENILNDENNFRTVYMFGETDASGSSSYTEFTPQSTPRFFVNNRRNVIYKFTDNSAMPPTNPSIVSFSSEILDPKTGVAGGVVVIRFASGEVRHIKINGASHELIALPSEYLNALNGKLRDIQNILTSAQPKIERARQIEREYLHMACNEKHSIKNLANETAIKICTWRNKFKDANEKSLAKHKQEIEALKRQAEVMQEQRLAQQQIATQQRVEQQQFQQQQIIELANSLGQFGQQIRHSGQQMLNSTMNQPAPQVNIQSPGRNRINCINTGFTTSCNY